MIDIVYGTDPKRQALDVYRPRAAEGKLPVIVSIHGGGWVYGDKERYQYYCMSLAQRGFAVVNFTYRLAPKFKFPASLEDTNLVFRWVLDHASEYGFDNDHFIMTANNDFLREAAPPMAEKLKALGVPVRFELYGDEQNPLGHVFHCDIRTQAAARCNEDECSFFRSRL